jgi:hypothetical protein
MEIFLFVSVGEPQQMNSLAAFIDIVVFSLYVKLQNEYKFNNWHEKGLNNKFRNVHTLNTSQLSGPEARHWIRLLGGL